MIPDRKFKSLNHNFKGFDKFLSGESIEVGYKPDFVLKKGNDYIILESENSSSRKTFVGGMIKAAHFLQNERIGFLVFVMVPKKNTTSSSIAKHLKPYLEWIQGKTNLIKVFVIEAPKYYNENILLALDCDEFMNCALQV